MTDKLKPCPFCGGGAHFHTTAYCHTIGSIGFEFNIRCSICGIESPKKYKTSICLTNGGEIEVVAGCENAILNAKEDWNRRADSER